MTSGQHCCTDCQETLSARGAATASKSSLALTWHLREASPGGSLNIPMLCCLHAASTSHVHNLYVQTKVLVPQGLQRSSQRDFINLSLPRVPSPLSCLLQLCRSFRSLGQALAAAAPSLNFGRFKMIIYDHPACKRLDHRGCHEAHSACQAKATSLSRASSCLLRPLPCKSATSFSCRAYCSRLTACCHSDLA